MSTFGWDFLEFVLLIFDSESIIYKSCDITFSALKHLDDIGLITFNNIIGFIQTDLPKYVLLGYYDNWVCLNLPKDEENQFELGKVYLTQVGRELSKFCGPEPSSEYFDYIVESLS